MAEKPTIDDLKKLIKSEFDKKNYKAAIELADKVLEEIPKDTYAWNLKYDSFYNYKISAPEEEQGEATEKYVKFVEHLINFFETECNIDEDQDKQKVYRFALNNCAWEYFLSDKSTRD